LTLFYYLQVNGTKTFVLVMPDQHVSMYPYPAIHQQARLSQLDMTQAGASNAGRYPRFGTAAARAVTLQPGETLFIPAVTFHHIYAVTASLSVNVFSAAPEASLVAALKRHGLPGLLLRTQRDPVAAQVRALASFARTIHVHPPKRRLPGPCDTLQERIRMLAAFARRLVARIRAVPREEAIAVIQNELVDTRYAPLGPEMNCAGAEFQPNRCPRSGVVRACAVCSLYLRFNL